MRTKRKNGRIKTKQEEFMSSWTMFESETQYGGRRYGVSHRDLKRVFRAMLSGTYISEMYDEAPELFDMNKLSKEQRTLLFKEDPDKFAKLVNSDKLPIEYVTDLFISDSDKFEPYIKNRKLRIADVDKIANRRPQFFDKYDFLDLAQVTTEGWVSLLDYDPTEYTPKFFEHMHRIRVVTEVRNVFAHMPDLLPIMTIDCAQDSCVSAKEWALLLLWPEIEKANVTYVDDVKEWITFESSIEVLQDKSTATTTLNRALNYMNGLGPIRQPVIPWNKDHPDWYARKRRIKNRKLREKRAYEKEMSYIEDLLGMVKLK